MAENDKIHEAKTSLQEALTHMREQEPDRLKAFAKTFKEEIGKTGSIDDPDLKEDQIIAVANDRLASVKSALEAAATTASTMGKPIPPEIARAQQALASITITNAADAKIAEGVVSTAQQAEQAISGQQIAQAAFESMAAVGGLALGAAAVAHQFVPDNLKHLSASALNELQHVVGDVQKFMSQEMGEGENKIAANKLAQGNDIKPDEKLAVAVNGAVKKSSSALSGFDIG